MALDNQETNKLLQEILTELRSNKPVDAPKIEEKSSLAAKIVKIPFLAAFEFIKARLTLIGFVAVMGYVGFHGFPEKMPELLTTTREVVSYTPENKTLTIKERDVQKKYLIVDGEAFDFEYNKVEDEYINEVIEVIKDGFSPETKFPVRKWVL